MGKRILFGGLLAVGLSLALGGTAQAQHYGHNHGGYGGRSYGGYGGGYGRGHFDVHRDHLHYHQGNYRSGPLYVTPYRPALISPYGGFGNSYGGFGGYGGGYRGYNSFSNFNYVRPGFGISIGFGR